MGSLLALAGIATTISVLVAMVRRSLSSVLPPENWLADSDTFVSHVPEDGTWHLDIEGKPCTYDVPLGI